jgi:regulator of sigma E protease
VSFELLLKIVTHGIYPIAVVLFFFGLTIFVHEWGHFIMARKRGMVVERFSFFGLGPPIVKWVRGGVEYCICWIPIGAYVQIPQMAPMEMLEGEAKQKAEQLPPVTPLTKILVALAGPVMNVICALALACILWGLGVPSHSAVVGWVEQGTSEELAGIRPGDRVLQVNSQKVKTWNQLMEAVAFSRQSTINLVVERDGRRLPFDLEAKVNKNFNVKMLEIYPREKPFARGIMPGLPAERAGIQAEDRFVSIDGVPLYSRDQLVQLIGQRADQPTTIKLLRSGQMLSVTVTPQYNPKDKAGRIGVELGEELEVVRPGPSPIEQFADVGASMWRMAKALVHHKETGVGVSSLSGPVGISFMWWYAIVSSGLLMGIKIGVLLNLNLAILNLLPIPVLDGGHIVFAAIEAAIKRPLNAKLLARLQSAFAMLLIAFMLYITIFSDLARFFPRKPKTTTNEPAANPAP